MFGFSYFTPTKVVFGRKTEEKVAELIEAYRDIRESADGDLGRRLPP